MMDLAWSAARDAVVGSVLNNELVPVPNISQADHFCLFAVFIKDKKVAVFYFPGFVYFFIYLLFLVEAIEGMLIDVLINCLNAQL